MSASRSQDSVLDGTVVKTTFAVDYCGTLLPKWVRNIVLSMSVCLSVSLFVCSILPVCPLTRVSETTRRTKFEILVKFGELHLNFVHVACERDSDLLWWNKLCTSGFVDVMFSYNGASCVFINGESVTAVTTAPVPTKFSWTIKVSKETSWVANRGWNLLSTIALLSFWDRV